MGHYLSEMPDSYREGLIMPLRLGELTKELQKQLAVNGPEMEVLMALWEGNKIIKVSQVAEVSGPEGNFVYVTLRGREHAQET